MYSLNFKKDRAAGGSYTFSTAKQGQITVTDLGNRKIVRTQNWGALITHGLNAYEFGYEGGGQLNIDLEENGPLSITGNGTVYDLKYTGK